jgi:vitamin B12 transporter
MKTNKKITSMFFILGFGSAFLYASENSKEIEDLLKQKELIESRLKKLTQSEPKKTPTYKNRNLTEDILVTATRRELSIAKIGRSFSIIDRKTLTKTGSIEVLEALRLVEGVNIVQTSTRGGTTSIFTRGGESNFTKVLINGHAINSDGGSIDLDNLLTDDVERIEVVRGPGSSIYGNTAMTGIVNIITKRGFGPPTLKIISEAGSFGTFKENLQFSGGDEKYDYMFSYSYLDQQDGRWHNGDYTNKTFSANYGFRPSDDLELKLTSRFVEDVFGQGASSNAGPRFDLSDGNDENRKDHMFLASEAIAQLSSKWETQLKLSRFDEDTDFITKQDFSPHGGDTENSIFTSLFERTAFNWQNSIEFSNNYELGFGYDFTLEKGRNTFNTSLFDRRTNGFYVNNIYSPIDKLYLDFGCRFDTSTEYGDIFSGHTSIVYNLEKSGTKLRANVGNSFKAPTFFEIKGSNTTTGLEALNKDETVEKNVGYDIGFDQHFWNHGKLSVTWFENNMRNLVEFVSTPNFHYDQGGKAKTRGWEFNLNLKAHEKIKLNVNWTLLSTRVSRPETTGTSFIVGDNLLRRPHSTGNVSLNYQASNSLNLNLTAHYVGEYDDRDFTFSEGRRVNVSSHTKTDLTFNYDSEKLNGFKLFGTFENIFDENYDEPFGFPAEKSNFLGGITYSKSF